MDRERLRRTELAAAPSMMPRTFFGRSEIVRASLSEEQRRTVDWQDDDGAEPGGG